MSSSSSSITDSEPLLSIASTMYRASSHLSSIPRSSLLGIGNRSAVTLPRIHNTISSINHNYTKPTPDFESKYQDKLLQRAKAQGYTSVKEMMIAYRERREYEDKIVLQQQQQSNQLDTTSISNDTLPSHVKPLKDILHLDKIMNESPEFIEKLWIGYHANKNYISAVIPRDMYILLHNRSKQFPMFVIPVFNDNNDVEMYLLQHSGHQTYFTSLLSYKTHGSDAPILFTLTYYTDLIDTKGIVFVHGEGDINVCPLSVQKRLTQGMRNFYVDQEFSLVEQMHLSPNQFNFDHVLAVVKARMNSKKYINNNTSNSS